MSTVVPHAYKLRDPGQFWGLVTEIKVTSTARWRELTHTLFHELMGVVDAASEQYQKHNAEVSNPKYREIPAMLDKLTRCRMAAETMEKGYQESSHTPKRHLFDLDASVVFYCFEENIYLRLFADMFVRDTFDWKGKDERFIEYHYQNRSDRPDEVSEEDWVERGRVWNGIYPDFRVPTQLVLEVSKYDMYWALNPMFAVHDEILQEFGFTPNRLAV